MIFETRKLVIFMSPTSLDVVDVIAKLPVCIILCKQANLIEENVSGQWVIRFSQFSRIELMLEIWTVLQENWLKMLIF